MAKRLDGQNGRATLQAVAELAQVSPTTVSLVLAGKAGHRRISEDTHVRVRKAAEELNYAPNLLTRSLRRGRTHIISFFSSFRNREEHDQYMDKLVASIESAGGQAGYDILVFCNYNRSPKEIYQFLNGGLADGLILFAPSADDPLLPLLRKSRLPVVIINGRDPERMFPSVADDMEQGMRLIVDELVNRGHRRIGAFLTEGPQRDASPRIELLRRFLEERGLELAPHHSLVVGPGASVAVANLMALPDRPTAVFCWHDRLAYRVLAACEQLGIGVPSELSVVGYDGIQWPATTSHVASSANVDMHALARGAIRILDRYIEGYDGPLLEEVLPVSFLRGTSLGPASNPQRSKLP